MHENDAELAELQALLDASLSRSTDHLRSIIKAGERTLTAGQLAGALTGMCVLAVATVTARGEPRISAVDGHFWHGRRIFGTERPAAKAVHVRARPVASVAHIRGAELGVFAHGTVQTLDPAGGPASRRVALLAAGAAPPSTPGRESRAGPSPAWKPPGSP